MGTSKFLSLAVALPLAFGSLALAEGAPEASPGMQMADPMPAAQAPAEPGPSPREELGTTGYDTQGREGRIHVVRTGDTLWDVSNAYLGTPWVWPSIWQDNRNIENPHLIYPGDHIWITPWEMRKVTAEEAEALLAGQPADAKDPAAGRPAAAPDLGPTGTERVRQERATVRVSDHERIGLLSSETVDAAASIVANTAPRLMISQQDEVWIGLAGGETQPGEQFTVYRVEDKVRDFETGRMLGYHVVLLGWIEVLETREESSLAVVRRSASEMQVGDRLIPRRELVGEIAILDRTADIEGRISFLPQSRTAMGTLDYVYLNRGTEDGLAVGSALEVYRRGFRAHDVARNTRVRVSDRVVADLLVVRAEPRASVALVRRTDEELTLGDFFRGGAE